VSNSQLLLENASRIAEVEKELARLGRVLGNARLAQPGSEKVLQIEEEAAIVQASLETLINDRLRLRREAVERSLASKTQLSVARERLRDLIEDARWHADNANLSEEFRKKIERARREAVITRGDVAKELALTRKGKAIDAELHRLVDDMLEARMLESRTLDTDRGHDLQRMLKARMLDADRDHDLHLKVLARAITDILGEIGMLRRDIDSSKVHEILWAIVKGIVGAAAGSSALALYRILSSMDPSGQARAAAKVYEETWRATKDSVMDATPLFAEPIAPRNLFGLLFHLAGPL
jgi:hypothetical protein